MNAASEKFTSALYGAGFTFCRTDLEDAFRALVGWPGEAPIPNTNADQRQDLLAGVCCALIALEDERIMPGAIVQLIDDEVEGLDNATYLAGAKAVAFCPAFFDRLLIGPELDEAARRVIEHDRGI